MTVAQLPLQQQQEWEAGERSQGAGMGVVEKKGAEQR